MKKTCLNILDFRAASPNYYDDVGRFEKPKEFNFLTEGKAIELTVW